MLDDLASSCHSSRVLSIHPTPPLTIQGDGDSKASLMRFTRALTGISSNVSQAFVLPTILRRLADDNRCKMAGVLLPAYTRQSRSKAASQASSRSKESVISNTE